jgi:hypothetical protein
MTITIETINGKKCTVIRKPFDPEWVKKQLAMVIPLIAEHKEYGVLYLPPQDKSKKGTFCYFHNSDSADGVASLENFTSIIVVLPALPRKPKPDDVRRIHEYESHGLEVWGYNTKDAMKDTCRAIPHKIARHGEDITITHALYNGERVEIALED